MKLMGIEVEKKIEGGVRLDFCKDDEMAWVVVRPLDDCGFEDNADAIFLYVGAHIVVITDYTYGDRISDIDYDNELIILENEPALSVEDRISAIGCIENDTRPDVNRLKEEAIKRDKDLKSINLSTHDFLNPSKKSSKKWD